MTAAHLISVFLPLLSFCFSLAAAKTVTARFDDKGVQGFIRFDQASPVSPLAVEVDLHGLQGLASGFHVHEFPMNGEGATCFWRDTGPHFPFDSDGQDLGDLSGKHGGLDGFDSYAETFIDEDLTLFGPSSIVGRSIVIHRLDEDNSRWVCANIGYAAVELRTLVAAFSPADGIAGVEGTITLVQSADDPDSETTVLVELQYPEPTPTDPALPVASAAPTAEPTITPTPAPTSAPTKKKKGKGPKRLRALLSEFTTTVGHTFHVHEHPLSAAGENACSPESVGGHFNPIGVPTDPAVYDCNGSTFESAVSTCEVGDLSGKHGPLALSNDASRKRKVFFTDFFLPLSGPNSVAQRSIVVHAENGGATRIACGSLEDARDLKTPTSDAASGEQDSDLALIMAGTFVMSGLAAAVVCAVIIRRRRSNKKAARSAVEMPTPRRDKTKSELMRRPIPDVPSQQAQAQPSAMDLEAGLSPDQLQLFRSLRKGAIEAGPPKIRDSLPRKLMRALRFPIGSMTKAPPADSSSSQTASPTPNWHQMASTQLAGPEARAGPLCINTEPQMQL